MESFGRYLRSEREQRGISIEEISRATKVSPGQLKAIEADDLSALPPLTYVKGFIRAYAKHIGIDPNDAIMRFENYLAEIGQEESMSHDFVVNGFQKAPPNYGIAVAAGGIILFFIVVLMILVRACGGGEEAYLRKPSDSPSAVSTSAVPSFYEQYFSGGTDENAGERVISPLPVVPPDAFRVSTTGTPMPFSSLPATADSSAKNPAGGGGD